MSRYEDQDMQIKWGKVALDTALVTLVTVVVLFTGCGGYKEFHRYQVRADAHNTARAERLKVEAVVARAEQRYQESVGIKRAQDEINKTLTPLYVQHEAIQALERSGAATVYIPSGNQGVPLVRDTAKDHVEDK